MSVITRYFTPPKDNSYFLFGPRGTGKSTYIKKHYQNALIIDLLHPEVLRRFLSRPERLFELIDASSEIKTIVLDEVQRAPSLLSVVHSIIEMKKGHQFILTGSSARKLKKTSADLLGGRALKRVMHTFMASELGQEFNLIRTLQYGLLPLLYNKEDPQDILSAYIELYLQEEIQTEGLVRNLESFVRFLEAIAFSHASLLNVTNISRECEVKRKTVSNYIEILEDLLLAFQLTNFTKRAQRELIAHSKFYLFDVGIFRTLRATGPLDRPEEIDGAALEGLIAQHLMAWNDYNEIKHQIHFWRTRSGVEVDFIIYGPLDFVAIEVKNAKNIQPKDLRSLETFLLDYPMAKALLLYKGEEILRIKNVLCLPCEIFLKKLIPNQTIDSILQVS